MLHNEKNQLLLSFSMVFGYHISFPLVRNHASNHTTERRPRSRGTQRSLPLVIEYALSYIYSTCPADGANTPSFSVGNFWPPRSALHRTTPRSKFNNNSRHSAAEYRSALLSVSCVSGIYVCDVCEARKLRCESIWNGIRPRKAWTFLGETKKWIGLYGRAASVMVSYKLLRCFAAVGCIYSHHRSL